MAQYSAAEPPQFLGGGPLVHVRNTFIDVEEEGDSMGRRFKTYRHAKTAPPDMLGASNEEKEELQVELLQRSTRGRIHTDNTSYFNQDALPSQSIECSAADQVLTIETPAGTKQRERSESAAATREPSIDLSNEQESEEESVTAVESALVKSHANVASSTANQSIWPVGGMQQMPTMLPSVPNNQPPMVCWMPMLIPVAAPTTEVNDQKVIPSQAVAVTAEIKEGLRNTRQATKKWAATVAAAAAIAETQMVAASEQVALTTGRENAAESTYDSGPSTKRGARERTIAVSISDKSSMRLCRLSEALRKETSMKTGCQRISWCVDARRLRGNVKQIVSPSFEVPLQGQNAGIPFRMTLHPRHMGRCKGGSTFEMARGRGYVQVKCEGELFAEVGLYISIGSGDHRIFTRGPVWHDFSEGAVAGLSKGNDEWDFTSVLDRQSETFVITLEMGLRAEMPFDATHMNLQRS